MAALAAAVRLKVCIKAYLQIPHLSSRPEPLLRNDGVKGPVVPLQLFSYNFAVLNGRMVDSPRNLAKAVVAK